MGTESDTVLAAAANGAATRRGMAARWRRGRQEAGRGGGDGGDSGDGGKGNDGCGGGGHGRGLGGGRATSVGRWQSLWQRAAATMGGMAAPWHLEATRGGRSRRHWRQQWRRRWCVTEDVKDGVGGSAIGVSVGLAPPLSAAPTPVCARGERGHGWRARRA